MTECGERVVRHVIGKRLGRVKGRDFLLGHEHADDVTRGAVEETLADDAQGDATQFGLQQRAATKFVENRHKQGEMRADVGLDELTAGLL